MPWAVKVWKIHSIFELVSANMFLPLVTMVLDYMTPTLHK